MTDRSRASMLSVAEVKRRFSEVIERVERGEQIVVSRHGKPVMTLVRSSGARDIRPAPLGLAAVAGALGDWLELPKVVDEIYTARRRARDRAVHEID